MKNLENAIHEILQISSYSQWKHESYFADLVFVYLPLLLNQFHDCAGAGFTAKEATQG